MATCNTATESKRTFRCGTLEYTKRALVVMMLWLLWGDFCFMCMEMVHPTVLPLMLKGLGASNVIISIYVTTAMNVMNFIMNPIVSFKSDRFRSKWGRRRPFLIFATPFVTLFLVLTGYSREIGSWVHNALFVSSGLSSNTVTIGIIGLLVVGYQFFHMIVGSVYYYLFNDVVPEEYLGRFLAFFRAVGVGAGALYQFFVYKYAEAHSKEIFVIFAIVYFVGFLGMSLRVKEGDYPPAPRNIDKKDGFIPSFKTFFKESFFTNSFYWKFYAIDALMATSFCAAVFNVFWFRSIGISLDSFGKMMGISQIIGTLLLIPAGMMCDKKHPLRVILLGVSLMAIATPLGFVFLHNSFAPNVVFWLAVAYVGVQIPGQAIYNASALPLFMKLLPHERYGQFSAANAMVRSVVLVVAGAVFGFGLDKLKAIYPAQDYYYRFIPFWVLVFQILAIAALLKLFKAWKKLGGDEHYTPPCVDSNV